MNKTQTGLLYWLVTLALALSACVAPAAQPAAQSTQSTTSAAFPVTLEHKYGSTTITQAPQRVVTVGLTDHDALLALGIVPVGTTEWFGGYPGSIWLWAQYALLTQIAPTVAQPAAYVDYGIP